MTIENSSTVPPVKKVALIGECMLELSGTAFGAMQQSYGGDTFNTAVYLQRCGGAALQTWYATALGDDALSAALQQRWAADGLQLDLVRTIAGRMPGLYQIEVDAHGERRFSFWRDQSAARAYFDVASTPLEARADSWDAFYFSGISLAILPPAGRERLIALALRLRQRGATVVFDNNYRPRLWADKATARTSFCQAFAAASTLLITADDHQALFEFDSLDAAVADAQALQMPELVIKRGAADTLVRVNSSEGWAIWHSVPTELVLRVVDTTAAGDSFAAAYLSQRLQGRPAAEAAQFGNRLAARVIQHPGAIIPLAAMQDLLPV
ncbi:MAG: ketodeoxygluconokinase [Burkholderiales bacterium PBB3]|nr:MAG: ketodeoxygluconokinase [Burkholderiales bacterium PBB3]